MTTERKRRIMFDLILMVFDLILIFFLIMFWKTNELSYGVWALLASLLLKDLSYVKGL